ncbi:TMEM165/GDT1 family protein [Synechococcus elongatus]|uniref:TMEM165/GDT1 family protein n=1 Tax=Synechococcus elongatus TaxID=32046 RepID=UPI0030D3C43F
MSSLLAIDPVFLKGFTSGLIFISIAELGDKTFLIAALLAMRHRPRWVFLGTVLALALMTLISVAIGQVANRLLPEIWVRWAEIAFFAGFGIKLWLDASRMPVAGDSEEEAEAEAIVEGAEAKLGKRITILAVVLEAFSLVFVAEWGDRTQFTTMALAAAGSAWGVALGAILGHAIVAVIAVSVGRWVSRHISERLLTQISAVLFLIFAGVVLGSLLLR